MRRRLTVTVTAIVAIVVALATLASAHDRVIAWTLPRLAGLLTKTSVSIGAVHVTGSDVILDDVRVEKGGKPLLDASSISVKYSPRDLLPGSRHRFGLRSIDVSGVTFTLIRLADGKYNIPLQAPSGPAPVVSPHWANPVPLAFSVRVTGGAIALRSPYAIDPRSRKVDIAHVTLDASVNSAARTHYVLHGAFVQPHSEPFTAVGTVDQGGGFAMHHVTAPQLPVRELTDFFINTQALQIDRGSARNLDLRVYALGLQPDQPVEYHVGGGVAVDGVGMRVVGLSQPVRNLRGRLHIVDGQLSFTRMRGAVAGLPISATGAVFNFASPQFHIGISTQGNLSNIRRLFAFAKDQDIAGNARFGVVLEGSVDAPTILAGVDSGPMEYRGMPFDRLRARIGYHGSVVSFLPIEAHAQGADLVIRGGMTIGPQVHTQAAVHILAPADALPYAGELLGTEPLVFDALLDGIDTRFYGYGALASARGIDRAAAVIHAGPQGVIDVAPFEFHTARGTLFAGYHLDRGADSSRFWIAARHVDLRTPAHPSFAGVSLPALPPMDGMVDRATILGGGPSGNHSLLAGDVSAHAITIAGVNLDALHARFAGTLAGAAIDPVTASGPWGTMNGTGELSLGSIAVRGRYDGNLAGLRPFMAGVPASGTVHGTAAIALSNGRITIQADDLTLRNANVRGIAISHATGTFALDRGNVRIYNARAGVAGGTVVAAGNYTSGIAVVADRLEGSRLRAIGLPLDAGRLDAAGRFKSGAPLPQFDGGVSLSNGRVQQYAVSGSGLVTLGGDGAHLDRVVGGIDGIYAFASGDLSQLTTGAPAYAVHADVPAGNLATAIATIGLPSYSSDGTFNAALDVHGAGLNPQVLGPIGVPAGSVNGLPFVDARGDIAADRSGVVLRRGAVTVGSTHLQFFAAENPRVSAMHVRTSHTDLADFNNFFNTGDTLGGIGAARFDVISQAQRLSTNGDISIAGLRYRNLPIGNTAAAWSSAHNLVKGSLDLTGAQGTLRSHGSVAFASEPQLFASLRDSRYDLTAALSDVDLSTWIAAAGYPQVPLTGRFNGNATLNGRFPQLQLRGNLDLEHGSVWRLPIDAAAIAFSSKGKRISIDSSSLTAPGLSARASGSFGLDSGDPMKLSVYASSSDLARLVAQLWRKQIPVSGDFESTLNVGGTFAKPAFDVAFDATGATLRGVSVPLMFGSVAVRGHELVLQNAGVQLAHGTIAIEGSMPIAVSSGKLGLSNSPLSFDLAFNQVDPSAFDALLGNNTKLGGTVDGTVGLAGTIGKPSISGRFSIAKGSYVSDLDRTPITGLNATLTFNRTSASINDFRALLGNGSVTASGSASFPNGFVSAASGGASYAIQVAAKGAQLDLPLYGAGAVDAHMTLSRSPGQIAALAGSATLNNATLPFSAFIAATQGGGPALPPLALGFDVTFNAGQNVRVRGSGYGAGMDIGGTGGVHLSGAMSDPKLDGRFAATSGTLTYFDRAFRVQQASVVFNPDNGLIPTLHATGETRISNPDPNTALNPYGSTDVTVAVDGPINALKVAFSSDPPGYSNEQILAMIAPFGGLINGISYAPGLNQPLIPGMLPNASLAPIPGTQAIGGTASTGLSVGQEAFNILNAQFSAGLLSPLEGALSQGLGFQNVNLTLDYYGNVGISASRFLGKTVNLVYSQTFGIPQRTSFGFQLVGQRSTRAQFSFYFQNGPQRLFETPVATTSRLVVGEPLSGSSGFAFTLQRLFW